MLHFRDGGFGLPFIVSAVISTVFLVLCRLSTRALWLAIGWHIAWDWIQYHILGLSAVNEPDYNHALIHLKQQGPVALVGVAPSIEGGLLGMLIILLGVVGLIVWMRTRRQIVNWQSHLDDEGRMISGDRHEVKGPFAPDAPLSEQG